MLTDRMKLLLMSIAQDFEHETEPLSHAWLQENNVTFSEVQQICTLLAACIRGFVHMPMCSQSAFFLTGCLPDVDQSYLLSVGIQADTLNKLPKENK